MADAGGLSFLFLLLLAAAATALAVAVTADAIMAADAAVNHQLKYKKGRIISALFYAILKIFKSIKK